MRKLLKSAANYEAFGFEKTDRATHGPPLYLIQGEKPQSGESHKKDRVRPLMKNYDVDCC
jgi:hypothetical protein